jgi:hypothetical protein
VYSINATFVTSCNTTKVRTLDVIVPRPSTNINAKRISITRIYFAFFGGSRNDRLNEFVMLIYIYNNAMRSCNERTTLHCVESYLYYVILVNNKIFSEEWNEGEKKIDNIHCRKYKIYIYDSWRVFLTCFAASGNDLYIFRQCTYIVSIMLCQKPQRNCQIV